MTVLIITPKVEKDLKALRQLAERADRKLPIDKLKKYAQGFDPNNYKTRTNKTSPYPADQTIELPNKFKITLSVEEQPFGWALHMSMSSPKKDRVPSPEAIKIIMKILGFKCSLEKILKEGWVCLEEYAKGRKAINILEPLELDHNDDEEFVN